MYRFLFPKFRDFSLYQFTPSQIKSLNRRNVVSISNAVNNSQNTVVISRSRDIFENLAFEDWLFKHFDKSNTNSSLLLVWYNEPCVVVGRHQNPWLECSFNFCESNDIAVVRRNSGGGTVYHDFGNVNFSFLTPRNTYDRKRNLHLICEAIHQKWPIKLTVSQRDDILYEDHYKVSGTASKLGRNHAYHHCTILVDVDKLKLHNALHREIVGVESKATVSTRAEVKNLSAVSAGLDVMSVIKSVSDHYKHIYGIKEESVISTYPNEEVCPGISSIRTGLESWEWRFGRTPRFTAAKSFSFASQDSGTTGQISDIEITIAVNKGRFENVCINPQILSCEDFSDLCKCIIGVPFSLLIQSHFDKWTDLCQNSILCHFVSRCVLDIVSSIHS